MRAKKNKRENEGLRTPMYLMYIHERKFAPEKIERKSLSNVGMGNNNIWKKKHPFFALLRDLCLGIIIAAGIDFPRQKVQFHINIYPHVL